MGSEKRILKTFLASFCLNIFCWKSRTKLNIVCIIIVYRFCRKGNNPETHTGQAFTNVLESQLMAFKTMIRKTLVELKTWVPLLSTSCFLFPKKFTNVIQLDNSSPTVAYNFHSLVIGSKSLKSLEHTETSWSMYNWDNYIESKLNLNIKQHKWPVCQGSVYSYTYTVFPHKLSPEVQLQQTMLLSSLGFQEALFCFRFNYGGMQVLFVECCCILVSYFCSLFITPC